MSNNDRLSETIPKSLSLLESLLFKNIARIKLLIVIIIIEDRFSKDGTLINESKMPMGVFPKPFKLIFVKKKLARKMIISNEFGNCSFAKDLTKVLLWYLDLLETKIKVKNTTLNTNIVIRFAKLLGSKI